MNKIIILFIIVSVSFSHSCIASSIQTFSTNINASVSSKKQDVTNILKNRFDRIAEWGYSGDATEVLNLYFAIKGDLNCDAYKKLKNLFAGYYERAGGFKYIKKLADAWKTQIEDTIKLNLMIQKEYEKAFQQNFCLRGSELHVNKETLEYICKEFGEESIIAHLFAFAYKNNEKAKYTIGRSNFIIYQDIPVFIRHHGEDGDGMWFPQEETYRSFPWLAALFYMQKELDYRFAIQGQYVRTYLNLCSEVLLNPEKLQTAQKNWSVFSDYNFKDYLAEICLMTMCTHKRLASKEKASIYLKIRVQENRDIYPNNKLKELHNIQYIISDEDIKNLVLATTYADIYYDLYDWYQNDIDTEEKINIIDACLSAFDDIQKNNLQWDYSKKSPMDLLLKKKIVIIDGYGKDSDIYKDFIINDVVARFGEYSEEYDTIIKK